MIPEEATVKCLKTETGSKSRKVCLIYSMDLGPHFLEMRTLCLDSPSNQWSFLVGLLEGFFCISF